MTCAATDVDERERWSWQAPVAKPGEPELKLPSDAEVDKVISFLEKVWRRLIEMATAVQKDVERKN
jgi:hypothetical protein